MTNPTNTPKRGPAAHLPVDGRGCAPCGTWLPKRTATILADVTCKTCLRTINTKPTDRGYRAFMRGAILSQPRARKPTHDEQHHDNRTHHRKHLARMEGRPERTCNPPERRLPLRNRPALRGRMEGAELRRPRGPRAQANPRDPIRMRVLARLRLLPGGRGPLPQLRRNGIRPPRRMRTVRRIWPDLDGQAEPQTMTNYAAPLLPALRPSPPRGRSARGPQPRPEGDDEMTTRTARADPTPSAKGNAT